jgi:hypothetical protein
MAFHTYVKENGWGTVMEYPLNLALFPGYRYLGETEEKPLVDGYVYVNGGWVWGGVNPPGTTTRADAYPPMMELFDSLWKAMDEGALPKVPGFYDRLAKLNEQFPPK